MQTKALIETDEAKAVLQNLYDDDPKKLVGFLNAQSSSDLVVFLESKARSAINARNQALEQGLDKFSADEIANDILSVDGQSETKLTKLELAKLALFKVKEQKGGRLSGAQE